MKPVWLLDIDGVINGGNGHADCGLPDAWPKDRWIRRVVNGYNILAALDVIEFIQEVHAFNRAEIRWHTTWQNTAHEFAEAFNLPVFDIAEAPEFATYGANAMGWWKLRAAQRIILDERRSLIWTDDDLGYNRAQIAWSMSVDRSIGLLISPDPVTGLTPKHLRQIGTFLDAHEEGN